MPAEHPEVLVHPNCCEAGAIGAALQAIEQYQPISATTFPGFDPSTHSDTRSAATKRRAAISAPTAACALSSN